MVKSFEMMVECRKGMWRDERGQKLLVSWATMDRWKNVPYRPDTNREPMAHACIFYDSGDERALGEG